jgi:hypothetical protein
MTTLRQSKEVQELQQRLTEAIEEHGSQCEGYTDVFYPENDDKLNITTAKFICATCPIVQECQDYALAAKEEYGIWGGLTPDERKIFYLDHKKLARQRRWREKGE